jgi:putative two-component system response regulator
MTDAAASKGQSDRPTIVVIDDDPTITLLFESCLEPTYRVHAFTESIEALRWFNLGTRVDLIIADLYMPEIDGIDLVKRLRELGRGREIPVIVLSGTKRHDDRVNVLRSGADDFVGKPIGPAELIARVDIQLRRRKPPAVVGTLPLKLSLPASGDLVYNWPPCRRSLY